MHVGETRAQRLNAVIDKGDVIPFRVVILVVARNDEDVLVGDRALPQKIDVGGLEGGTDVPQQADDICLYFQHLMEALYGALQVGVRDDLEGGRRHGVWGCLGCLGVCRFGMSDRRTIKFFGSYRKKGKTFLRSTQTIPSLTDIPMPSRITLLSASKVNSRQAWSHSSLKESDPTFSAS